MVGIEVQGSLEEVEVVQVRVQWRVSVLVEEMVVDRVVVQCYVMRMPFPMVCLGAAVAALVVLV